MPAKIVDETVTLDLDQFENELEYEVLQES